MALSDWLWRHLDLLGFLSAVCKLVVLLYRCLVRVVNKQQGGGAALEGKSRVPIRHRTSADLWSWLICCCCWLVWFCRR